MSSIPVRGKGMTEDRHNFRFDTPNTRIAGCASSASLWGWIFGAFVFVSGFEHVVGGGYLLIADGIGAAGGALVGALAGGGIREDRSQVDEADLRADRFLVIAHGAPADVDRVRHRLSGFAHSRLHYHRPGRAKADGAT